MADRFDPRASAAPFSGLGARAEAYDAGLRAYMLSVYNYMTSGVLLTGVVALLFAATGAVNVLFTPTGSPSLIGWVAMLAPLAIVFAMSFGQGKMQTSTLQMLFWAYAALMGVSLSTIFIAYTGTSIAGAFFATAAAFAGLSLWGYTTGKDLSAIGTFLLMGLVGLIFATLINLFLRSETISYVISMVGVLLFAGLTAYDTQRTKSLYRYVAGTENEGRVVIMSALSLYLDFINMFLFILRLFGSSRN